MEFALSEDQQMLADSLRRALAAESTQERMRAAVDGNAPMSEPVWQTLRKLGIPALLVPEEHGGLALTLLDAAIAAEELGRAAAPAPFVGCAVLAPLALRFAGSAEQQLQWLPRIAAGEAIVGAGLTEVVSGARDGAGLRFDNGVLTGRADFVIDGAQADAFIIGLPGNALVVVDAKASGVQARAMHTFDGTRPVAQVTFTDTPAQRLPGADAAVLARLRDAAWLMQAADVLGSGWTMIDRSVAYAKERRQFGRLIGSFQAVKHLCAEMATALEPGRALLWYAAHAFDLGLADAPLYAAHAKALLGEAGRFVGRTATEVHGGIGITDELGLHYWFKRLASDRMLLGSPAQARSHAAALQGLAQA